MARTGQVLHPDLGLRFKAAVVTTDLPLVPDKPIDFGLQDFCEQCKKCAKLGEGLFFPDRWVNAKADL